MRRLVVLAVVLLLSQGCTFIAYCKPLSGDPSHELLGEWITEAERRRATGAPVATWVEDKVWGRHLAGRSWDDVLGVLYAMRSGSVVRESGYISPTGTIVWFWGSAMQGVDETAIVPSLMIATQAPIMAAFEVVFTPLWWGTSVARQWQVADEDLLQAVEDIHRARELGYPDERVWGSGSMGWPRPYSRHLDVIGYDAQWLREHRREQ